MPFYPDNPGPLDPPELRNRPKGKGPLKKGDDRKQLVKHLQRVLKELGYHLGDTGPNKDGVDGDFGYLTRKAVEQFQKKNKDWEGKQLKDDCKVGPLTSDALNRKLVRMWYDIYQTPEEITESKNILLYTIATDAFKDLSIPRARKNSTKKAKIQTVACPRIKIESVTFMSPDNKRLLTWNDIVGLNIESANIKVTASRISPKSSSLAPRILIELKRRPPEFGGGDKITSERILHLDPKETEKDITYTNKEENKVTPKYPPPSSHQKKRVSIATVARDEGTSDEHFREGVKTQPFVNRGSAIEKGGDKNRERPPPRELFLAGGVEVVEVKVKEQNEVKVDKDKSTDKILIRSPADIFYYSGHGYSNQYSPPGELISVPGNIKPEDLIDGRTGAGAWQWIKNNNFTVEALIIAGCSVCSIHKIKKGGLEFEGKDWDGVGKRWKKLLTSKKGCVRHICGYWGSAPDDAKGGNEIAKKMGEKVAGKPYANHSKNWMQIHLDLGKKTTAASLTDNTFSNISPSRTWGGLGSLQAEEDPIDRP